MKDKDDTIEMFKKKVADYDAATKKIIKAITGIIDKIPKDETELRNHHAEFIAATKDSQVALAVPSQASQGLNEAKDEKTMMFEKKVAEFVAAPKKPINAIKKKTDKAADITTTGNFGFVCML